MGEGARMKILKWLRWQWFCYRYHYCPKHAVPAIYTCLKCVEEREERLKAFVEAEIAKYRESQ